MGRRARTGIAITLGLLVAVVVAGGAAGFGGTEAEPAAPGVTPPATVAVTRGDLIARKDVSGTLGYGQPVTVATHSGGTVTWLPNPGDQVGRGQALFRVDEDPVPVLFGTLPLYRTLQSGVTGADVKELEANLVALGYGGFTADDAYTAATAGAVRAWQAALGRSETGTVAATDAVVTPGVVRVAERRAAVGDPANGPVVTYTGTAKVVAIDLDVHDQPLAVPEAEVTVRLPNGSTLAGTVAEVGTVATSRTSNGAQTTTIPVTVMLADQTAAGSFDGAPVSVRLVSARRNGVLTVPINALLALREGGFGVEVVEGDTSRVVPIETGLFASGRVEITGGGIADGMRVGVPR